MYKIRKGSKLELVSLAMVLAAVSVPYRQNRVKEVVDYIKFELSIPTF